MSMINMSLRTVKLAGAVLAAAAAVISQVKVSGQKY
jgi:hypothetical protein